MEFSGVSSTSLLPGPGVCLFSWVPNTTSRLLLSKEREPGEGRTRREQKASVAGKESLTVGTKRCSGWGWLGSWLLLGVLQERWQLMGTGKRVNEWIWMREDGCPSTGPYDPGRGTDPLFSVSVSLSYSLAEWIGSRWGHKSAYTYACEQTQIYKHIQIGCLALVASVSNGGHALV